jgi:hypothetical protein
LVLTTFALRKVPEAILVKVKTTIANWRASPSTASPSGERFPKMVFGNYKNRCGLLLHVTRKEFLVDEK